MFLSAPPVPCVAVEIAPAMLWESMSPRFSIARPTSASLRFSSWIVIPAWTRTSPDELSTSRILAIRSRLTRMPSVQAMSENECPAPATRTRRPALLASFTTPASSSSEDGCSIATGLHRSSPAQLRHSGLSQDRPLRRSCGSLGSLTG